ncbi:3-hydroxybutyrate dehydrogenase [Roseateles oligotrophus]|uniref:3-hydroxybutyrate dehydrogenase n=1 Tax=Roseateles oligotrophus TaxID=1769250 RepID=A0ABT2YFT5_9BURK|nr:3-hydroxybutyrate dehydrogenase [Roseateles oligotrophus]MCV2368907.1 3-hydroxybutyrate dehydrogenase [Roseateles oligotrophus]
MLRNKVAVVTGSTSGIGLGIARQLAAAGADLMINGFGDAAEIEALRQELASSYGVRVAYNGADLSDGPQATGLIESTLRELGSVDVLINNAGIQYVAPVHEFPIERWDAIIAINLSAVFLTTRAALPIMRERKWGRIINIASVHGLVASADKSAYVASKHGVVGLTKTVALETATSGITCNAICPGWVLTPLVQKQIDALAAKENIGTEEAKTKLLSEKQPSLQFASPEQLGALTVFLCSDAAAQMTGVSLPMDGGWVAR